MTTMQELLGWNLGVGPWGWRRLSSGLCSLVSPRRLSGQFGRASLGLGGLNGLALHSGRARPYQR